MKISKFGIVAITTITSVGLGVSVIVGNGINKYINSRKSEFFNNKLWTSINSKALLFRYKYATGGKTGYTPKAGRTLVSTASKDNNEKYRNSAIIPKGNFSNELKRKGNIANDKKKEQLKVSATFNKIDSIKEVPEDDIDHLKKFNDKGNEKNKKTKK